MTDASEWQGRVGQQWAREADGLDFLLGPMGAAGIEAMGEVAGLNVLDLGCGAGASSLALAGLGAKVTGLDISGDLIGVARERAQGRVEFVEADAATARFDMRFDRLFSRFGCMFFGASQAAFENLRLAMVPGAEAVLVAWTEPKANAWISLPVRIGRDMLGAEAFPPMTPGAPGPFGWDKQEYFMPALKAAGWQNVSAEPFERELILSAGDSPDPIERAIHFCLRIGPSARRFKEIPDERQGELTNKLSEALAPYVRDDAVRVPGKAWMVRMVA